MAPPHRIERLARGSLLVALGLAILGKVLDHPDRLPFWGGLLAAFGEAALVGGLADWFAVRALFAHPLGIPLPHTALIPRNRDRIIREIRELVLKEWLPLSLLRSKLEAFDFVGQALLPVVGPLRLHLRALFRSIALDLVARSRNPAGGNFDGPGPGGSRRWTAAGAFSCRPRSAPPRESLVGADRSRAGASASALGRPARVPPTHSPASRSGRRRLSRTRSDEGFRFLRGPGLRRDRSRRSGQLASERTAPLRRGPACPRQSGAIAPPRWADRHRTQAARRPGLPRQSAGDSPRVGHAHRPAGTGDRFAARRSKPAAARGALCLAGTRDFNRSNPGSGD